MARILLQVLIPPSEGAAEKSPSLRDPNTSRRTTMLQYQVQKGDTISAVTRQLNTDWATLRKNNPNAVGRSARNGNWFLKEGATVQAEEGSFDHSLQKAELHHNKESIAATPITPKGTAATPPFSLPVDIQEPETTQAPGTGNIVEHTLQKGETLWDLAVNKYHVHVKDIMADNGITDPRTLQIGQKLQIRLPEKTGEKPVVASWYGEAFHGKPMANGDIYDMNGATIAHKEMPLGTRVELKNIETGEMVRAVVTDRGPYIDGRDVDLSYGLAKRLSLVDQGVGNLVMRVL